MWWGHEVVLNQKLVHDPRLQNNRRKSVIKFTCGIFESWMDGGRMNPLQAREVCTGLVIGNIAYEWLITRLCWPYFQSKYTSRLVSSLKVEGQWALRSVWGFLSENALLRKARFILTYSLSRWGKPKIPMNATVEWRTIEVNWHAHCMPIYVDCWVCRNVFSPTKNCLGPPWFRVMLYEI